MTVGVVVTEGGRASEGLRDHLGVIELQASSLRNAKGSRIFRGLSGMTRIILILTNNFSNTVKYDYFNLNARERSVKEQGMVANYVAPPQPVRGGLGINEECVEDTKFLVEERRVCRG